MLEFYTPDAEFNNMTMKWSESIDMAARKKELESNFSDFDKIKMSQVGYPDCIYYAENDSYVVYSWWILSTTSKADGKKIEFPIMLSHNFNNDGKIVFETAYYSSNHFE